MSGSDGKCSLYSKDGLLLRDLVNKDVWVRSVAAIEDRVVVGTDRGELDFQLMSFGFVNSLHAHKFAFQENNTEVGLYRTQTLSFYSRSSLLRLFD